MNHIKVEAKAGDTAFYNQSWFEKVEELNPSYKVPVEDQSEMVANWFDIPEQDDDEPIKDVEIPEGFIPHMKPCRI